jgi:hypothetical protein
MTRPPTRKKKESESVNSLAPKKRQQDKKKKEKVIPYFSEYQKERERPTLTDSQGTHVTMLV